MANSRRQRPSAFDVSFPGEAATLSAQERASTCPTSSNGIPQKRRNNATNHDRAPKQQQLPPVAYYRHEGPEVIETQDLNLNGEDLDDAEEQEGTNTKPIRILTNFSFFDPRHRNEMVPLTDLEEDHGKDQAFEGAGYAVAKPSDMDEDEGQEEEDEDEPVYLRLGAIFRYTISYNPEDELVCIETLFAYYILEKASKAYEPFYRPFYTPRHIARLVILFAAEQHPESPEAFLRNFKETVDIFGRTYVEQDLWDAVPGIRRAIEEFDPSDQTRLRKAPIIRYLLSKSLPTSDRERHYIPQPARRTRILQSKAFIGDLDTAVLKKENLNRTTVTPSIFALAWGRVHEKLDIIGPPYHPLSKAEKESQKREAFLRLCRLVTKAKGPNPTDWSKDERVSPTSEFLKSAIVGGEKYEVGDVVLVRNGEAPFWTLNADVNDLSPEVILPDLFWFARIIWISHTNMMYHLQWYNHGSQIMLGELAHPQEIFLANQCEEKELETIVAKVKVHDGPFSNAVKREEFFCRFMFDEGSGAFTSIDSDLLANLRSLPPRDNCASCQVMAERTRTEKMERVNTDGRCQNGVTYNGKTYHIDDVVLFRAESGPAHIGCVTRLEFPRRETDSKTPTMVQVRRIGRISSLKHILPQDVLVDERHLFLTKEMTTFNAADLIQVVLAPPMSSLTGEDDLEEWLALSPDHFYLRYQFDSLNPETWNQRQKMPKNEDFLVCQTCWRDRLREKKLASQFSAYLERDPLPTLDLFGGVGAFSKGLAEGSECLRVTHAVEIGPSAAKTLERNSPGTIVYNQCANTMLRYAIKSCEGHKPDPPVQLFDGKTPVPAPPKPGEIKVFTIGFPCQTHSTLNRFQDVRDIKSNLILNALSWIDFYRPMLCYFENVAGFLQFRVFHTENSDVEGIEMGGLKLLKRGLLDMGYQVREGLLQAAHYGTPQRRERFFLIAALDGTPLPALPQPTHDFPKEFFKNTNSDVTYKTTPSTSLSIVYPNKKRIQPIRSANGTALHPCVTIGDAIDDLPRFDWTHRDEQRSRRGREGVPGFPCDTEALARRGVKQCGYVGRPPYHHPPKTVYQRQARMKPVRNLQHFTRILKADTVKRCINIRLEPNADYKTLRADLLEWNTANPSSAMVRKGFKSGAYGRLDMNAVFPTTVTNAGPTAKQSRCLHPDSHRMLTIREFARSQGFPDSFEFVSLKDKVITIQRQIGNAVPLPLANALGRELRAALFQKWKRGQEDAIVIDDVPPSSDDDPMDIS